MKEITYLIKGKDGLYVEYTGHTRVCKSDNFNPLLCYVIWELINLKLFKSLCVYLIPYFISDSLLWLHGVGQRRSSARLDIESAGSVIRGQTESLFTIALAQGIEVISIVMMHWEGKL